MPVRQPTQPFVEKSDCERLLDVTGALYLPGESCALRRQLLQALQSLVPHDLGACHWMQPSRHEIAAWYEPECAPLPVAHHEFWRLIDQHPLNRLLFAQPVRAWKLSDVMPRKRFQQTEIYSALYRPLDVDCEITSVLPDESQPGTFFLLSLHRRHTDFTERERTLLNLLLPHISRAQQRLSGVGGAESEQAVIDNEEHFGSWVRQRTTWQLSSRESEVLFWLCQGKTNDEIGTILGIAGRTAETHALRIYPKIGVENRYGAIATVSQMAARALAPAAAAPNPCLARPANFPGAARRN